MVPSVQVLRVQMWTHVLVHTSLQTSFYQLISVNVTSVGFYVFQITNTVLLPICTLFTMYIWEAKCVLNQQIKITAPLT